VTAELKARLDANLEAARSALEAAIGDPWVAGSMGQLKPHPGFSVAARCDEVALKLAMELGLLDWSEAPDGFAELDWFDEVRERRQGKR
jgi:hypothetical protein